MARPKKNKMQAQVKIMEQMPLWKEHWAGSQENCTFPRSACITQLHNQQLSGAMVKGQGPQSRLCYFYLGGLGFCK